MIHQSLELITGWKSRLIRKRMEGATILQALKLYGNPVRVASEVIRFRRFQNKVNGSNRIDKFIRSGERLFWSAEYCGFPSDNFNYLIRSEFPTDKPSIINGEVRLPVLKTLIWGITNRCPLSCSHCYEWDNIDQHDQLDLHLLKKILSTFKIAGIRHIQFSGGEPLVRFDDLVELTREASTTMDCWLLTSGFGLTSEKAVLLKDAGITGVHISLDHWDESLHNSFRNNSKSYEQALKAIHNCINAGIIVSLSLCATREFVREDNLMKYASLARDLGVHFIRILEPRAAGKYAGKDVLLNDQQIDLISQFAIRLNSDHRFRDYPIINFLGYHQRQMACFGAGNRFLYIDPGGDVHACPFCRGKMGNLLTEPFGTIIEKVKSRGCHLFAFPSGE
jgi:MoaA/NifB/PqqE/SkfB family radical SAM enzyme